MIRKTLLAAGAAAFLTAPAAHAQNTVNFANFLPGSSPNISFNSANSMLTATSQPVTFSYSVPNGLNAPFTTVNAIFTFSALVGADTNPSPTDFSGSVSNLNFSITANGHNLLSATSSTGALNISGGSGSASGSVSAGDNVIFTSDYLDLGGSTLRNFSFGMSGISPAITHNGTPDSFTSTTTGTFAASNVRIPEPGTVALMGMALVPAIGVIRRRRK